MESKIFNIPLLFVDLWAQKSNCLTFKFSGGFVSTPSSNCLKLCFLKIIDLPNTNWKIIQVQSYNTIDAFFIEAWFLSIFWKFVFKMNLENYLKTPYEWRFYVPIRIWTSQFGKFASKNMPVRFLVDTNSFYYYFVCFFLLPRRALRNRSNGSYCQ